MSLVLSDNVWAGGVHFLEKGTRQSDVDPAIAGLVGDHLWSEEEAQANVSAAGEALTGLADNVFVDGVLYEKGTTPPRAAGSQIGSHLWVGGEPPEDEDGEVASGVELGSDPADGDPIGDDSDSSEADAGGPPPASDGPPTLPEPETAETADGPNTAALDEIPPKGGPGSGKSAWAAYARKRNVDVDPGANRDDIIRDLEDAGVPTE